MNKSSKQEQLDQKKSDLWKLRHTAEHILHQAVKTLYPSIHLAMGPATEEGFYFDFDPSPEGAEAVQLSELDFPAIEKKMRELVALDLPVTRYEISVAEARKFFADNPYKLDWIASIADRGELVTIYWTGEPNNKHSMVDLCAGPHAPSTGAVKAFKLLSLAGAYWHGDEKNKMLTRIYGTAFASQQELDAHLQMQEEARKRDHKILGPQLDLFTFSDLVGPGLPLWTPKGTIVRNQLDAFVWELRQQREYDRVEIPHITKKELYQVSGHWDKFANELFRITTREGHEFAMKPMNCPHHTQIYARKSHSYRELPQRYANTTMCYRDEQTGELSGLSRVRSFTQDDAHVFCRKSQVQAEMFKIWDIIEEFYGTLGFSLSVRLSLSDPAQPEKYLGSREEWDQTEDMMRKMVADRGIVATEAIGEAAFYGPKFDFMGKDAIGRQWQLSTIQLDTNMPERFDLTCVNEDGQKERVVMIHAAIMGSIERFLSIIIEHFGGAFPVWLSPVQVKVLPISDKHLEYAERVVGKLRAAGARVELDDRAERLSAKIRDAQLQKIPYMLIVGDKEAEQDTVAVRQRAGGAQEVAKLEEFADKITEEIQQRRAQSL